MTRVVLSEEEIRRAVAQCAVTKAAARGMPYVLSRNVSIRGLFEDWTISAVLMDGPDCSVTLYKTSVRDADAEKSHFEDRHCPECKYDHATEGAGANCLRARTTDELRAELSRRTDPQARIDSALALAFRFGGTDEAHHKSWVIDQMCRQLAGEGYAEFVRRRKADGDDPDAFSWDEGIPP